MEPSRGLEPSTRALQAAYRPHFFGLALTNLLPISNGYVSNFSFGCSTVKGRLQNANLMLFIGLRDQGG